MQHVTQYVLFIFMTFGRETGLESVSYTFDGKQSCEIAKLAIVNEFDAHYKSARTADWREIIAVCVPK